MATITKICKALAPTVTTITAVALVADVITANQHRALVFSVLLVMNANCWIVAYNKD